MAIWNQLLARLRAAGKSGYIVPATATLVGNTSGCEREQAMKITFAIEKT